MSRLFFAVPFIVVSVLACGSKSDSSSSEKSRDFKCQYSTSASGDLCQVNFFCDDQTDENGFADGPSAYCSSDGECKCGPASENPKSFTHEGVCDLESEELAALANDKCGFGM